MEPNQNNNNNTPPEAPLIPESEMKLPEESTNGVTSQATTKSRLFNPLLIALFVVLLAILAVVIIWGEQLIGMVLPEEEVELQPLPEEEQMSNDAAEIEQWESELDEIDLSTLDEELNAIESEIEAEMEAEAEATTTTTVE